MSYPGFFEKILPERIREDIVLYNISIVILCLISSAVIAVVLFLAAFLISFLISGKLNAGMAGMSILLIFTFIALILSIAIFIILLVMNIRIKK